MTKSADVYNLDDLRKLKAELLKQEIRSTKAEADIAALRLAKMKDEEKDRMAKGGYNRRLPIDSVIHGVNIDAWIGVLEHWEYRDPGQDIEVIIDSPGGDVMGGFAIYDTIHRLRRKGHKVTTRGRGMVASMAGVLLQAGDVRSMDANAQLMIHEVAFGTRGKTSDMEEDLAFARRLEARLLGILAERSTMSPAAIKRKWKKTDWWLSAEEALDLGFVDVVE